MVLVDSNVILDVATADPRWAPWSAQQLSRWLDQGPVVINAIVYGEIAFATDRIEVVDELLPAHLYDYRAIPREAAFLAARAHALVERLPLLTRDLHRYRQAFPGLKLINPLRQVQPAGMGLMRTRETIVWSQLDPRTMGSWPSNS
jgi:predicted nucleic acid-binding protein